MAGGMNADEADYRNDLARDDRHMADIEEAEEQCNLFRSQIKALSNITFEEATNHSFIQSNEDWQTFCKSPLLYWRLSHSRQQKRIFDCIKFKMKNGSK